MFYVYKSIQKGEEIMNENKEFKPYIPADKITPEFTVTSIIMGVILAVIFGAANAYLGLRVGMTVSASIPAAVISMGVIRKIMKKNSILESNMVQTIGSAGESLAAGAIFTMPALFLWAEEGLCEMPGIAGDVFTNDIQSYVRQQHNIRIGERTAEAIKCSIGAAVSDLEEEPEDFVVTGPNMLTALPQTVSLSYSEIAYALEKSLTKIDAALMKVLESMPPELYADIVKNGIYLAGGGALIKGLDRRLGEKTGIPFHVAEDPLRAIARGTGIALKNINRFSFLMK